LELLARSPADTPRFQQFDSTRSGALSSQDLQRLLAKDSMMDAREDCVKMVRAAVWRELGIRSAESRVHSAESRVHSAEFADDKVAHEWV
jgi:hypothetical protein